MKPTDAIASGDSDTNATDINQLNNKPNDDDNAEKLEKIFKKMKGTSDICAQQAANEGRQEDLQSSNATYDSLVGKIATRLNIVCHPDPSVTLKAIRMTLEEQLRQNNEPANKEFTVTSAAKGQKNSLAKFTVNDIALPAAKDGDHGTDHASKVLKLLYLDDLRLLQTQVNEIIASVQSLTTTRPLIHSEGNRIKNRNS